MYNGDFFFPLIRRAGEEGDRKGEPKIKNKKDGRSRRLSIKHENDTSMGSLKHVVVFASVHTCTGTYERERT